LRRGARCRLKFRSGSGCRQNPGGMILFLMIWSPSRYNDGMNEPLGIALLGCGTVGGGVAKLLLHQADRLATRAGRPLVLRRVVVRAPTRAPAVDLRRDVVRAGRRRVLRDPSVSVVVELAGGGDWAGAAVLSAREAGKDVATRSRGRSTARGLFGSRTTTRR